MKVDGKSYRTIWLGADGTTVQAIDQTLLPHQFVIRDFHTVEDAEKAIRTMIVRGAPLIGAAAAYGIALAMANDPSDANLERAYKVLLASRPTAVNLRWAVDRVLTRLPHGEDAVLAEALAILDEEERANRTAARRAADLLRAECPDRPLRVLTHCNTGALATMGGGTALGAIGVLARDGRLAEAIATETRPLLQGARLTVWELREAGLPHRLCVDSAAPAAMATGLVDAVVVGADRIAANGDTANKVGTYALACAAAHNRIPFVVVAPRSTVDPDTPSGAGIPIEERDGAEVVRLTGVDTTVPGTTAYNPAFDVTPAELITAIVTDERVWRPGNG